MMEFSHARKVAGMLAALAEPTRLQIAYHLASGPHHVSQLAELVNAPMVNMSHHLGVMRQAGLLDDEKQGRKVVYQFRPEVFTPGTENGILGTLNIGPFRLVMRATADAASAKGRKKIGRE
jgi:DNA-binding transcriptional ArsR family regulator